MRAAFLRPKMMTYGRRSGTAQILLKCTSANQRRKPLVCFSQKLHQWSFWHCPIVPIASSTILHDKIYQIKDSWSLSPTGMLLFLMFIVCYCDNETENHARTEYHIQIFNIKGKGALNQVLINLDESYKMSKFDLITFNKIQTSQKDSTSNWIILYLPLPIIQICMGKYT